MAKTNKVRMNLEFAPTAVENLERMVEQSHSASRTEVIRKAIRLFDDVLGLQQAGGKLVFQHADGSRETIRVL